MNNTNNNNNNVFPSPKEDSTPMYHRRLGIFLMAGECVKYEMNNTAQLGRVISFDINNEMVNINNFIPQTAGHTNNNINTNMKMLRQTKITHTIAIDSVIDFRFMFTIHDIDKHRVVIGNDNNNFYYCLAERIHTSNRTIESIYDDSCLVNHSVSLSVFLDINMMRDQMTRKLNTRTSFRLNRFAFISASSNFTKSYLIRNMNVDVIEIRNIKKVCQRVGLYLQQVNNSIILTEHILRLDSMIHL
jgi:hypothetical protein